jgi:hypothetical protein
MLDALDGVDWGSLRGCYRTAEEVPRFLRALLAPAAEVREWGHDQLLSAIWHQGTVYEVSAAVVPFLYELLEADGVPDKGLIADLIATVADAHSYLEVHVRMPEEAAQWEAILARDGKTFSAELARELGHVAAVRWAVWAGLDVLYPYLRDPDPAVRGAVARAVRCFPEVAARMLPDLEAALQEEPDEYVRAVLEEVLAAGRTLGCSGLRPDGRGR